jgi:hypothetical protein
VVIKSTYSNSFEIQRHPETFSKELSLRPQELGSFHVSLFTGCGGSEVVGALADLKVKTMPDT